MTETTIGIDISKDHLDAHCSHTCEDRRFANSPAGLKRLRAWLADRRVRLVVYEATGAYHRALEIALCQAGYTLAKVNPLQARRFAEATGRRAKTDRVDAQVLAKMGQVLELRHLTVRDATAATLRELQVARRALDKDKAAAKNRAHQAQHKLVRQQLARRLQGIERDLKALDAAIQEIIAQNATLARRFEILCSIPGIGTATAHALLIDLPELGTLESKPAASLVGVAPMTRESGQWRGRASIRGGRGALRHALFMPTLVACRFNPDLKAKYEALKAAGKPPKVAAIAVMRKLVLLANALVRHNRLWCENPACA